MTVAVVGLGSTSTRLLVEGSDGLERHEIVTRLTQGAAADGTLADDALRRVAEALAAYRLVLDGHGDIELEVVATAAARNAPDRSKLASVVLETLGVEPSVLSGAEEGRLAYAGAIGAVASSGPVATIDIGGASTELVTAVDGDLVVASLDIGAGIVIDQFFTADPPRPEELSSALAVIDVHLDDLVRECPAVAAAIDDGVVVAMGGTVTTAAAVEIGSADDHERPIEGFVLGRPAAEDVFRTVVTESRADRGHNPGLSPDRVDVIVGGMCVLVAIMRRFSIDQITVTERGLLDGVAASQRGR